MFIYTFLIDLSRKFCSRDNNRGLLTPETLSELTRTFDCTH
jgi:hypothetical protein